MLATRLDPIVESGGFKTERGIVLRPETVLFIFLYFTLCLTFSLRLMVTHRLDSCDHLLYRLVTRYVPCLYCCRDFLCHVTYYHMSTDYDSDSIVLVRS